MLPQSLRNARYNVFYRLLLKRGVDLTTLGNPAGGCSWTFRPAGLNARSVVYSGGVGGDVSFEHSLTRQFGCAVILCDPSPTGARTMARPENQISQFHFHPVALSDRSGHLKLAKPLNQEGDWWLAPDSAGSPGLELPCTDLRSLMSRNNHDRIDLLKLDIEGSEYGVIEDILKHRIPVKQLCVEYHHGILPGIRRRQTLCSIFRLVTRGYKLVAHQEANHTFIFGEA